MAVNLSKNNLCINQIIEQKNEKITIESDEIVPDIKPDVLSIISSSGNICLHKKEVQDGKVRIEGTVNAYVVYIADDENSSMRAINANMDFSKNIEMKDLKSSMQLECTTDLTELECKIINGRKISLKANIQMNLTAYSNENVEYVDNIENKKDMQLLNEKININSLIGNGSTKVYAKDTVSIDNVDNLSEIMKVEIRLENKENKVSYNKILTKADSVFKIMYLTDINEDSICDVTYELKNIIIKPNNVEEHSVYVEAEFEIFCAVYKKQEINIIQDMYSRTMDVKYTQRTIKVIKDKEEISEVFNLRKQERIDEVRQNKIYDVEVKPRIISSQMENGKIIYQGEISLTFIYGQEGTTRINIKNLVEPFEFTVTSNSIAQKMRIDTSIEIAKKDFVVMADSTIDIKVDLNFRLNIVKESSINLIESVTESEKKDRESFSIIVYYARVGDTLWKIAKKFGSTVDEIVKVNGIENPDVIMPGEQLFIPR